MKDYYRIMGLAATASLADIKTAYRRQASSLHPDRNPSALAHTAFQELQEAYGGDIPADVAKKVKKFGTDVDGCQFLLNPKSFTQTVENIFHYSFLVKKGAASIALRDKALDFSGVTTKPGLAIKYVTERPSPPPAKQAIMTLTMQDWRDLCATYQVEEGDLPHRKINQQSHAASLSQASAI